MPKCWLWKFSKINFPRILNPIEKNFFKTFFVLKVRLKPFLTRDCSIFLWFIINCDSLEIWHQTATTMPPVKGRNFYSFLVSWQLIIKLVKFWGSAAACLTNDVVCLDYLPAEISKVDKRGLPFGVIKIFFCLIHKHWDCLKLGVVIGRKKPETKWKFSNWLEWNLIAKTALKTIVSAQSSLFSIHARGMEALLCNSAENTYMLSTTSSTRSCFKA